MADKRMLSKTISTSIRVGHLKTSDAMLLFTWMIPHCDDDGRLQGDPLYIKSIVVPMIECSLDNVREWLFDMADTKLIEWYEVDGEKYIQINKWLDFQRLRSDRYKVSKYPPTKDGSSIIPLCQPSDNQRATNGQPTVDKRPHRLVKIRLDKGPKKEPFELPSREEINESSMPKIKEDIEKVCEHLYETEKFPKVHTFKNKMLKEGKYERAILHTLVRCVLKEKFEDTPWGYCVKIIEVENGNYNEYEYRKDKD